MSTGQHNRVSEELVSDRTGEVLRYLHFCHAFGSRFGHTQYLCDETLDICTLPAHLIFIQLHVLQSAQAFFQDLQFFRVLTQLICVHFLMEEKLLCLLHQAIYSRRISFRILLLVSLSGPYFLDRFADLDRLLRFADVWFTSCFLAALNEGPCNLD